MLDSLYGDVSVRPDLLCGNEVISQCKTHDEDQLSAGAEEASLPFPITTLAALSPRWTAGRLLISPSHRSTAGVPPSALPALLLIVGMAKFTHVNAPTSAMEYSSAKCAASPSLRSKTCNNLTASPTKRRTAEDDPSSAETKCKS